MGKSTTFHNHVSWWNNNFSRLYPPVMKQGNWKSPINGGCNGKTSINGGNSIATFDCRRVNGGFFKLGVPQDHGFQYKSGLIRHDLGYPYFWKSTKSEITNPSRKSTGHNHPPTESEQRTRRNSVAVPTMDVYGRYITALFFVVA